MITRKKEHYPYPYSYHNVAHAWMSGINLPLGDQVPLAIREANDAVRAAGQATATAESEVGALARQLADAGVADTKAYARALADGQPDPGPGQTQDLTNQLDAAKRKVAACREAQAIVGERFLNTMRDTDLAPTVAELDRIVHAHTADVRRLLAQAREAREAALVARLLSRRLDAFPAHPSDANRTRPIGDGDAWRIGVDAVLTSDLPGIEESTPISLLNPDDYQPF